MNIIVCMKQVFATDTKLKVVDGKVDEANVEFVVNPYDEFAAEEALRIKEKFGDVSTHVVSLGPERAEKAVKGVLALGIDEGYLLSDAAFQGGDVYASAKAVAGAAKKIGFDLILCGKQACDMDNHQFGVLLAELLGVPHVSNIIKLELSADRTKATCQREGEGGLEVIETPLPAVLTADKGLNEPRYASLKGIMAVKKKTIARWTPGDLGLDASAVGAAGSLVEVLGYEPPPARQAGKKIDGSDAAAAAKEIVRLLREEAKVI